MYKQETLFKRKLQTQQSIRLIGSKGKFPVSILFPIGFQ
jgi:hypothetical protein